MSYLQTKRYKRAVETVKTVAINTLVITALAAVIINAVYLHLITSKLDAVIKAEAAEFVPATDPCTLAVVECEGEIEVQGESASADADALRQYLASKGGHAMAKYAEDIVKLYRWQDVVAIAWKETHFCTAGVGSSQNNCGGIKSARADRTFKHYDTVYDSLWDIAYLLEKPRYKGKSIAAINGTYCYDESTSTGECPNWTEVITKISAEVAMVTGTR